MLGNPNQWPADTVFIGVIDDGIAFAHERLRRANGSTRVEAYWDMNVGVQLAGFGTLGSLPGELLRPGIDALAAAASFGGVVDENLVYGRAGVVDHRDPRHKAAAWRIAHGAHVLDLAAGADPSADVRNRPVIAVQLPTPVVARTTGERLDSHILAGILYVLNRADLLWGGPTPPRVVINSSFGYVAGPHDGTGLLELAMDVLLAWREPRMRIVLPAGNAQLSRCHATIDFDRWDPLDLDWIVQPNDRTHSLVQVWLPGPATTGVNRISMTVTPPDGPPRTIGETPGPVQPVVNGAGRRVGSLYLSQWAGRNVLNLWIMPTDRAQPHRRALAPAGRWQLRFASTAQPLGVADAWVQRDDSLYGYPQRGRQAYFDRPDYVRFDGWGREIYDDNGPAQAASPSPINRRSLFNALATGARVLSAGGYLERTYDIAPDSAGGPNTPPELPPLTKPDVLLPSEGSWAMRGVLAAGSRSGARVPMSGTSVASPQLARLVADLMAANQPTDRASIEALALFADPPVPPAPPRPPNRGAGRLPRPDPLPVPR